MTGVESTSKDVDVENAQAPSVVGPVVDAESSVWYPPMMYVPLFGKVIDPTSVHTFPGTCKL